MSLDPEAKRVVEGLRMPDRSVEQVRPGTRSGRASVERAGHQFLYFGVMALSPWSLPACAGGWLAFIGLGVLVGAAGAVAALVFMPA